MSHGTKPRDRHSATAPRPRVAAREREVDRGVAIAARDRAIADRRRGRRRARSRSDGDEATYSSAGVPVLAWSSPCMRVPGSEMWWCTCSSRSIAAASTCAVSRRFVSFRTEQRPHPERATMTTQRVSFDGGVVAIVPPGAANAFVVSRRPVRSFVRSSRARRSFVARRRPPARSFRRRGTASETDDGGLVGPIR
jgi:hypothetical protein